MLIFASAVSAFYVPSHLMSKDKIQSREHADGIDLRLANTPK